MIIVGIGAYGTQPRAKPPLHPGDLKNLLQKVPRDWEEQNLDADLTDDLFRFIFALSHRL
jgi:hypothetical protein